MVDPIYAFIDSSRPGQQHIRRKILRPALHLLTFLSIALVGWSAEAGPLTGGQGPSEFTTLEVGKPIERELAGGQKHSYQIVLAANQCASVIVEQRGIDVAVQRIGSEGNLIAEYNYNSRLEGPETLGIVADAAGVYRVNVKAQFAQAPAGRYEIRIGEVRTATEQDLSLQEANQLFTRSLLSLRAGKYDEALPLAERAAAIVEKVPGQEAEFSMILSTIGSIDSMLGSYAKAEVVYLRALAIMEKQLGRRDPEFAGTLMGLANTYNRRGDYIRAEPLRVEALGILEKELPADHPYVALALNNLANLYFDQGLLAKAQPLYARALEIYDKAVGPDEFNKTVTLNNLGNVYRGLGDYAMAESFFLRTLDIRERTLGKENSRVGISLNNLGSLCHDKGDYAKAEAYYLRALSIFEKTTGFDYPQALETLEGLAVVYAAKGDWTQSVDYQARANAVTERNIALNLAVGSEAQKMAFLASVSQGLDRTISLHTNNGSEEVRSGELAATTILQRKGRALDAMSDSLAALHQRFTGQDQTLLDQLNDTTAKLAKLVLNAPQGISLVERQQQIQSLESERDRLEGEVSRRSGGFYPRTEPVSVAAVRAVIPVDAALVEFSAYRPFDPRAASSDPKAYGEPRYVACVIRAGALLKQRLLFGALLLKPEEIRSEGAGQMLGRVVESSAVESLALSGGFLAVVALLELVAAATILTADSLTIPQTPVLPYHCDAARQSWVTQYVTFQLPTSLAP